MALQEEFEKEGNWLFKHRGNLPIILIIGGLGFYLFQEKSTTMLMEMVALAVSLLGLGIRIFTVGYTPANTSGRNVHGQVASCVNNCGIYSLVRHPLYLGNFFMWIGPLFLTMNPYLLIIFTLIYWVYYERIMFAEEQYLRGKFGAEYVNWSNSTPTFIPRLTGYRKPYLTFSLRKVLKREKNGLLGIFTVLLLLNGARHLYNPESELSMTFVIGFIVSLILYFILKIIKYKTQWLEQEGR